jgi:hypothetical protein
MATATCKIKVGAVRVLDESSELSSSDEPYVIVWVADVSNMIAGISVPNAKTTLYAFTDADEGELLTTIMDDQFPRPTHPAFPISEYCWGPNDKPTQINGPDQLVILAGMMENDDGSPSAARAVVNGLMAGSIANMAGAGLSRADMVKRLTTDLDGALTQARITGAPDFDDRIGPVKELRLTQADLDVVAQHKTASKTVTFNGGDADGAYRVRFDLVPG